MKTDFCIAPLSSIEMPQMGLGCAPLGDLFVETNERDARDTLEAAWMAGVRYFDTAPWYGHGLSEHRLGGLLRQHSRADYFLSTKVGRVYSPAKRGVDKRVQWVGGQNFGVTYDYSAKGFAQSYAQSQLRLGQSSIDALVIHDLDQGYHQEAFSPHVKKLEQSGLHYLHDLKSSGEISAVGMGINSLEDFDYFSTRLDVDFFLVAMPYTLLDQVALDGAMKTCIDREINIVIGAPFASGLLTNPSNPDLLYNYGPVPQKIRTRALDIEKCCYEFDVPLMAAALQFPMFHPAVCAIIPGALRPEHVQGNVKNSGLNIPKELWRELKKRGLIHPDAPTE